MRKRKAFVLTALASLLLMGCAPMKRTAGDNSGADPEMCAHLKAFQQERSEKLPRRWIELHWVGYWMDFDKGFGKACRHSGDSASAHFCEWITDNSSTEFPYMTPMGLLECHGYKFPRPYDRWAGWRTDVPIYSDEGTLTLLEVRLDGFEGETGAIRLSVFGANEDDATQQLPPIARLPPHTDK